MSLRISCATACSSSGHARPDGAEHASSQQIIKLVCKAEHPLERGEPLFDDGERGRTAIAGICFASRKDRGDVRSRMAASAHAADAYPTLMQR
jgi:hypothetical protein